jgi:hypothetical protein
MPPIHLTMDMQRNNRWKQIAVLTGMYLAVNAESIAADRSAALGVSVTVVRSCQFDSGGLLPASLGISVASGTHPAVNCGLTTQAQSSPSGSSPSVYAPTYQVSADNTQLTLTVSF